MFLRSMLILFVMIPASMAFQGTKVGIIDADNVIQQSKKGKTFLESLEAFSNTRREELNAMAQKYDALRKDAEAKAASMSATKKEETAQELQRMEVDIKRKQEDATREAEIRLKEGLEEIRKEMLPLIRQVAIEKNLDMVLNMGPQSQVVYFHDRINITKDVIAKYDEMVK